MRHGPAADTERGLEQRLRFETLRALLDENGAALQALNDLAADLNHLHPADVRIRRPVMRLLQRTMLMAQELNSMAGDRYVELYGVLGAIHERIQPLPNHRPQTNQTLGELARRSRKGV